MAVQNRLKSSPKRRKMRPHEHRSFDPSYFTWPSPFWIIVVSFSTWLLLTSTLSPRNIPTFLGPIATFGKFMGITYPNLCIYLCAFGLVVNVIQAAFAGKVCHDRGMVVSATIKWVFATLFFGFPSLVLQLLPYKPDYKTV